MNIATYFHQCTCEVTCLSVSWAAPSASLPHPPHPRCHDEAGCSRALLCSVPLLHFCLASPRLIHSAARHGPSIGRIIFCVRRQFCLCRVTAVCFGIRAFIECVCDESVLLHFVMLCVCAADDGEFCFYVSSISRWFPVAARHGPANQQTALQLFSCPPLHRERWEGWSTFRLYSRVF